MDRVIRCPKQGTYQLTHKIDLGQTKNKEKSYVGRAAEESFESEEVEEV